MEALGGALPSVSASCHNPKGTLMVVEPVKKSSLISETSVGLRPSRNCHSRAGEEGVSPHGAGVGQHGNCTCPTSQRSRCGAVCVRAVSARASEWNV